MCCGKAAQVETSNDLALVLIYWPVLFKWF
jgi:hypothetical protein